MSNTQGNPGFFPSNTVGRSGLAADQVGSVGAGVLQTIEEGGGALTNEAFYYTKDVGYFQLPSVQRSHGDDRRTLNVRNFGQRGTVTLNKKDFLFGPTLFRFKLPIGPYRWAGCEYTIKNFVGDNVSPHSELNVEDEIYFTEVPGCDTLLPASFQSGGLAFAFPSNIEVDLGGAGKITFDRYSNWAAIMASTPFRANRKDLMRMAGGGLDLNDPCDVKNAPVVWGYVDGYNAAGNQQTSGFSVSSVGEAVDIQPKTTSIKRWVPVEWDVFLPIKTPETNFYFSLARRKPLDLTCLSGDYQFTFTWANFYEYTDTGVGYPNAPCYLPQSVTRDNRALLPNNGGSPDWNFTGGPQWIPPFVDSMSYPHVPARSFICQSVGTKHKGILPKDYSSLLLAIGAPMCTIVKRNPRVWTNHYRVAAGRKMGEMDQCGDSFKFVSSTGTTVGQEYGGRPRYPQFRRVAQDGKLYQSNQNAADVINSISQIRYPDGFSFVEFVNSSLKLTNVSLGAYNSLRVSKNAALYYPFQYFYSQIYRVNDNPYFDISVWDTTNVDLKAASNARMLTEQNKMTVMIQMPANPVTSMLVSIFREKDRKYLGKNAMNSYSPVLFWNALNPERMNLWDGGNLLFSYDNAIDAEMYSMIDRPDALKVPFKGGLCKVSPKGVRPSDAFSDVGASWTPTRASNNSTWLGTEVEAQKFGRLPWTISVDETTTKTNLLLDGFSTLGYTGSNTPANTRCSYPADDIVSAGICDPFGKLHQPCHLVEEYEATIMEFPFVMNEPLVHEDIVQSTPSFAKTQLKMDFWINPKLKPDNGFDDQYDFTYGLTRGLPSGIGPVTLSEPYNALQYPGTVSHPVPDCLRVGVNADHPELLLRSEISAGSIASSMTTPVVAGSYSNGYSFKNNVSSWNINNGALFVHITYCQNQVWTQSPLRTSILSARG